MLKINYISLIILVILSASAYADFETIYEPVDNNINFDAKEYAEFRLTIKNTGSQSDRFIISSPEADRITWDVKTKPLSDYILNIESNSQKTITLLLRPIRYKTPLEYVTIRIESQKTSITKTQNLGIGIEREQVPGYYIPVVDITTKISDNNPSTLINELDPREKFVISVELKNKNPLNITSMQFFIDSKILEIKEIKETNLDSWQTKTVYYQYNINPLKEPEKGEITIEIKVENTTLSKIRKDLDIIAYSNIEKNVDYIEEFLKTTEKNILTNKGNIQKESTVSITAPRLWKYIIKSNIPYRVEKKDRETYLVWDYKLDPLESKTIEITYNYRPIAILIIFIIMFTISSILLYYNLRSDLVITKAASGIGTSEGGISELKVLLHIKNRTSKVCSNVDITDRIPKLADLDPRFDVGTLKPSKVLRHDKKGTAIKWFIETLDPFEERVITYKVQSKLSILGGVTLPQTHISYRDEKDNDRTTSSNKLNVVLHKHQEN